MAEVIAGTWASLDEELAHPQVLNVLLSFDMLLLLRATGREAQLSSYEVVDFFEGAVIVIRQQNDSGLSDIKVFAFDQQGVDFMPRLLAVYES